MKIPKGTTEAEVTSTILKVVNQLASRFRFGYHEVEDMKQQGVLFALEMLEKEKYDEVRPLENFLYKHLRNRLINFRRDNYTRSEPPCHNCVFFDPKNKKSKNQCAAFENKDECEKLSNWKKRNDTRKCLMKTVQIDSDTDKSHSSQPLAELHEFEEIIDRELSSELRSDYIRMRQNQSIPKTRRMKVQEAILEIKERYYEDEDE